MKQHTRSELVTIGCGLAVILLLGCPQGTKTTLDVGVRVGTDTCKEDRSAPASNEYAFLDCADVSGEGRIRVQFPRTEWYTMRARAVGTVDAGPGK